MGYFTPDGILIQSSWRFFITPAVAGLGCGILAVLFFAFRRRLQTRRWMPALVLILGMLSTVVLLLRAASREMWAIRANDFVRQGVPPREIRAMVGKSLGIPLPGHVRVGAAVSMGWREYTDWYGVSGETDQIVASLREGDFREIPGAGEGDFERLPEPVARWVKSQGFTPGVVFVRNDPGNAKWAAIDRERELVLFRSVDH